MAEPTPSSAPLKTAEGAITVTEVELTPEQKLGLISRCKGPLPGVAAVHCTTCNDEGAVGNILTAEPCPDCSTPPQAVAAQAPAAMAGAAAAAAPDEDVQDMVSKALRKAWQLGQTYWQQADSDYASQWKKSDVTQAKFHELIDETRAAMAAAQEGGNAAKEA